MGEKTFFQEKASAEEQTKNYQVPPMSEANLRKALDGIEKKA